MLWSGSRTFLLEPETAKMNRLRAVAVLENYTVTVHFQERKMIFLYFSKLYLLFKLAWNLFSRSRPHEPEPVKIGLNPQHKIFFTIKNMYFCDIREVVFPDRTDDFVHSLSSSRRWDAMGGKEGNHSFLWSVKT